MSRTLGAQEYTSRLKNRVVSKSVPQAADQKSNNVVTSIRANRATQVVKEVSDPTKSCSGGWTDKSDCCGCSSSVAEITIGVPAENCQCSAYGVTLNCPGPVTLFPFDCPKTTVRITISSNESPGPATGAFILVTPQLDLTGMTATADGFPMEVNILGLGGVSIAGEFDTNSTIVLTFPYAISELSAFCSNFGPP